jgi:hypothetical protein
VAKHQVEKNAQGHSLAQNFRVWEKDGKEMVRVRLANLYTATTYKSGSICQMGR